MAAAARLILCADDFALSPATSEVIAGLAAAGRLSAIGCMAAMPCWPTAARLLAPLPASIAVGLHLVMTDEAPLGPMPRLAPAGRLPAIATLTRRSLMRALPLAEIAAEIDRQFAAFESATGHAPAFVDGHQHWHVLPGLRDLVLAATARHAPAAWLRSCEDRTFAMLRRPFALKALRSALLSAGFAARARSYGLATNQSFAGHYDFDAGADFARRFAGALRAASAAHLVMVHPGADDAPGDAIAGARANEAALLAGQLMLPMIARAGLALAPRP